MKRLAIFLDGTWNDPGSETNVSKLHGLIAPRGADNVEQRVYYDEGVGNKAFEKVLGGAVGMGLSLNLRQAYGWLLQTTPMTMRYTSSVSAAVRIPHEALAD